MALAVPPVLDLPPMDPTVVVAGDVHLSPDDPAGAARFEAWLGSLEGRCATLVLLGDVFDWWVGRRQAREPFPRRVLDRLAALARAGTRLAFLAGNRDYAFDGDLNWLVGAFYRRGADAQQSTGKGQGQRLGERLPDQIHAAGPNG